MVWTANEGCAGDLGSKAESEAAAPAASHAKFKELGQAGEWIADRFARKGQPSGM